MNHTPGALRAAKRIVEFGELQPIVVDYVAAVIDHETGAQELLEALKSFRHVDGCFCEAAFAMPNGANPRHSDECETAQAAIAKAEGRA